MIRIFVGCSSFEHSRAAMTRIMGTQDEKNHLQSIFLLQFLNVLFMADTCAKFEKNIGTLNVHELF